MWLLAFSGICSAYFFGCIALGHGSSAAFDAVAAGICLAVFVDCLRDRYKETA